MVMQELANVGNQMNGWRLSFDEFRGKVTLVTGASTGIGAAVASAFASCGARTFIHFNASADKAEELAETIRAKGGDAHTLQADLTQGGNAEALVSRTCGAAGRLDILINNAGSIVGRRPFATVDDTFYEETVRLNQTAVFAACRAAVPVFRGQGSGVIVNTTSLAARMGGGPGTVIYAATKAAVSTLTRGLARELAPEGIRVNAVAPGLIVTPLHERHTPSQTLEAFRESIPMRRLGTPYECVGAYLFLASERLAGYVTGQVIEVNGGQLMP
jgi:3-oxoacyl-[acyl-carrier protein] reductase